MITDLAFLIPQYVLELLLGNSWFSTAVPVGGLVLAAVILFDISPIRKRLLR